MPKKNLGPCTALVVDPGTTTGLLVISMDPRWFKGQGPATWEGLGAAVRFKAAYQVGREPKAFALDTGRATKVPAAEMDSHLMPIMAKGQPLLEGLDDFDGRGRKTEAFYAILAGEPGEVGRGDLLMVDAGEILQIRQIAGLLDNFPEAALVIEDFTLRIFNQDRETLSPARLRLGIQAEEAMHGVGRVPFLQQPGDAFSVATNERLKRANLYFAGMKHATDAARHAAKFFRDCRTDEELRAQAFPRHFSAEWE